MGHVGLAWPSWLFRWCAENVDPSRAPAEGVWFDFVTRYFVETLDSVFSNFFLCWKFVCDAAAVNSHTKSCVFRMITNSV